MWGIIYFSSIAILALGILMFAISNVKNTITAGKILMLLGIYGITIGLIFTSSHKFNSKDYKFTIETRSKIINNTVVKCDTFYILTPKQYYD